LLPLAVALVIASLLTLLVSGRDHGSFSDLYWFHWNRFEDHLAYVLSAQSRKRGKMNQQLNTAQRVCLYVFLQCVNSD